MAHVSLDPGVLEDLDRIIDHLRDHDSQAIETRVAAIVSAFDVLRDNPLIGRPTRGERRELLIGRGVQGYVALYRCLPVIDTALVLAIRAQREGGYGRD